jgi:hypothetical protein
MNGGVIASWPSPGIAFAAFALFAIGLGALAPLSAVVAPYSFITVLPAFLIGSALGEDSFKSLIPGAVLGALIAPVFYLWTTRYILRTGTPLPKASVVAFVVIVALSVIYAATGWEATVRYTFVARAIALVVQAVLPPLLIAIAAYLLRNSLTPQQSLKLHWAAFAWIAWSAFPWYGELL